MKKEEEASDIDRLIKDLEKEFGVGVVFKPTSSMVVDVKTISTGSFSLDQATGVGGLPRGRIVEIYGPEGGGKCHKRGTGILMYNGSIKKVEDLKIGDKVMGIDSLPRTIQRTVQGRGVMYEIKTKRQQSDSFVVNEDHVLSLRSTHPQQNTQIGDVVNISVKDYLTKSEYFKIYHQLYRVPVDFPNKETEIDPYFLGLWLGGSISTSGDITIRDQEIIDYLEQYAKKLNLSLQIRVDITNSVTASITRENKSGSNKAFNLVELLRVGGVLDNKHIPDVYKINSRENRLKLLAGLIDSSGYAVGGTNNGLILYNNDKNLSEDVLFLARSLGFYASIRKHKAKLSTRDCETCLYEVYIDGDYSEIPLLLKRRIPTDKGTTNSLCTGFTVKKLGVDDFYGFILDGDHLYLLDNFIVNHNTTLCLSVVAQAQKLGDLCAYVDVENALDLGYAKKLGVDVNNLMVSQPNSAEEALNLVHRLISSKKVGVIVIDSVAALVPKTEDEGDIGTQTIGLQARMMSQAMRKLQAVINKTNTLVIFINQIRMKIGGGPTWGNPETTSGGKALPFAASMRIDVRRIKTLKEDDLPVGILVKAKIAKNKVAAPFKTAEYYIIFGEGISLAADIFNIATTEGIIDKKGKTYWYGDQKIGVGVKEALATLKQNKELLDTIHNKLDQYESKKVGEVDNDNK
jgi:protein RecA